MPSKKGNEQPLRRSSRLSRVNNTPEALPEKNGKRRRNASPDDKPEEKIKRKKNGRQVDSFCWICHKQTQEKICALCDRVYHSSCLNRSNQFSPEGFCAECQLESLDGVKLSKALTVRMLRDLLSYAMQVAFRPKFKNQKSFQHWPEHRNNKKLLVLSDGETIFEKIHSNLPYTKTAEFFSDVKWMYHNCCIIYGKDSSEARHVTEILKILKLELLAIEACPWCYEVQNTNTEFFVQVCKEPHTILWAKLKGFPYWPAKCLKVISGIADVRFFGTHDKARIPASNCYLLSEVSPNKSVKDVRYKFATEELDRYIANYEYAHGSFRYAPLRTVFKPGSANHLPIKRAAKVQYINEKELSNKMSIMKPYILSCIS